MDMCDIIEGIDDRFPVLITRFPSKWLQRPQNGPKMAWPHTGSKLAPTRIKQAPGRPEMILIIIITGGGHSRDTREALPHVDRKNPGFQLLPCD